MEKQLPQPLFTLGRYQILELIGKGGMGEVFLAYDTINKKNVALKRLLKDSDKIKREQFLKEAEYTRSLNHPSIIPIYSLEKEGDTPYYTMLFLEGLTLKEIIRSSEKYKESLASIESFTQVFLQICRAIAYAHSQGYIHRDLKPSNIMINSLGEVMILDWGLVMKATEKKKDHKVEGTMSYIAPELIYGENPTSASEVYSLGMIFYHMLTFKHPFHRSTIEEYNKNNTQEVLVPPQQVAPYRNINPILCEIALKCLSPKPVDRYQTVKELIEALECFLKESKKNILEYPERLFSEKKYLEASLEYHLIGKKYLGTEEGRKALFLEGFSLFQEGKKTNDFKEAFLAFERLKGGEAAPFGYLGQILISEEEGREEETFRLFEEAFHHYKKTPLLKELRDALKKKLLNSKEKRERAPFCLLASLYLSEDKEIKDFLSKESEKYEKLFFLNKEELERQNWEEDLNNKSTSLYWAFVVEKPSIILEIIEEILEGPFIPLLLIQIALFSLLELGEEEKLQKTLDVLLERSLGVQAIAKLNLIQIALKAPNYSFEELEEELFKFIPLSLTSENLHPLWHIFGEALHQKNGQVVHKLIEKIEKNHLCSAEQKCLFDCYQIWAFLIEKNTLESARILDKYPTEEYRNKESTLNFLKGCHIAIERGKRAAIQYFSPIDKENLTPLWEIFLEEILLGKKVQEKYMWRKKRLERRLSLFASACL